AARRGAGGARHRKASQARRAGGEGPARDPRAATRARARRALEARGPIQAAHPRLRRRGEAPARIRHAFLAYAPRAVRPRPRAGAAARPGILRGAREARRAGRARLSLAGDELSAMAKFDPEILAHLEWIDFIRP